MMTPFEPEYIPRLETPKEDWNIGGVSALQRVLKFEEIFVLNGRLKNMN